MPRWAMAAWAALPPAFLDSMATLKLPAFGYGIRYDYGVFKQRIESGWQMEEPDNWLRSGNPWEVGHPEVAYTVKFEGHAEPRRVNGVTHWDWVDTRPTVGMAYDTPIVGYDSLNVNTLRAVDGEGHTRF